MTKNLKKISGILLVLLVAFSFTLTASTPKVSAAPTVPATNNYPYPYDPELSTYHPDYWQVGLIGPYPRASQNLPDGYWYPNTAFDSAWFPNNYAVLNGGTATLRAFSDYDMWWGGRGWANAFVHQGRIPYAGGIYEGHFKAGASPGSAIPVDGIRYSMYTTEPTGKHYLEIRARVTTDNLNRWQSNNGLLVAFLFQYEFLDGSLSAYDSPAFTNNMQNLHVDLFIHRTYKFANIPSAWVPGWYYTLGDRYNADIHLQRVYNGKMDVGQYYTFIIDYGDFINGIKGHLGEIVASNNLPRPRAIILRYIQVSAETCGGEIAAEIDYIRFVTC
ncbi:MAG: hypothetical protein H5T33_05275 [Candidatus Methanosuratus sp.]|nr:hypothetical protein [Candidatus Methanosuratincola sp.]